MVRRAQSDITGSGALHHRLRRGRLLVAGALFLFSLALTPSSARTQESIQFRHLTVNQGLSQGSVICILQDSFGFLWFGTQDGLNRYDGYEITIFKHDPADSSTLIDNFVITLAEDSSGTLWIGTLNKPQNLSRFDRTTETFAHTHRDSVDLRSARVGSAFTSYEDPSGVRWSGAIGEGVTRFDRRTGKTTVFKHDPSNPSSLLDDRVYSVFGDRSGTIWVGTREGLERFDPETETFIHYRHDKNNPASLSDNWVWPILEDRAGALWVGTYRGGLNRFDRVTGTFTRFRHEETDSRSLGDDRTYSLFQDRSGMIWVGTDNGVDRFNPEMGAFARYSKNPRDPASLIDNSVYSIHVDRSGAAWIGTLRGLDRLDRTTGAFTHFQHDPANPASLGENMVQSILEDRSGVMWFGTQSNGLDRYDRATGRFTHFRHDPSNPRSISDNMIYSLLEDRQGVLWIGTYHGGLNRFDRATGTFRAYQHNDSLPGSLGAKGIWALHEDRNGVIWVGTYKGGLDRFDREMETFTHFKHDPLNQSTLSNDAVVCFHEDRTGTLWVGTMSGLNRFDKETGTFKRYSEKDGLPNSYIVGILEDDQGRLWISTVKGISRFDPRTETFRNYDQSDGLQGDEFNTNAFARDARTGEMYFGGTNGFNVFHPDRVLDNTYLPPIVFSGFTRYNTDDEEGTPIVEKGIAAKSAVTLSYKDNVAHFEFAALSYYNTFKNQYAYKLEGFSDNWIQLGTERRATFTNLDGGEYTLRVKGSNNDGVWNDDGAALHLTVTPPWWKTRWAYAGYGLIAFTLLYGLRRFELNRREQKARIRESELRAKAALAEKRVLEAENERKSKELEDARQLQLSMLPGEVPTLPGYDIAVFMRTATEVGGDYYDFSRGPDGTLHIAFGDATGHGMQAGTIVTLMKGLFLSDASRLPIESFFQHASRAIKEIRLGRLFMAFSLVRVQGRSVSFSSAGMPPAYLFRRSAGTTEEIFLKGMPLGAMKNASYAVRDVAMDPGDALLFITDGLPEQKNGNSEMFDYARVQQAFSTSLPGDPDSVIRHLVEAGDAWMNGAAQDDDITLMVIQKTSS
ncbi:MAG: signal transduction histidine kinase [Bacteroidetes bacterium]|nr:signal transduction histidine kinase [Bacteroidota bacterium]